MYATLVFGWNYADTMDTMLLASSDYFDCYLKREKYETAMQSRFNDSSCVCDVSKLNLGTVTKNSVIITD